MAEVMLPLKQQWAVADTDYVIDERCAAVEVSQAQIAKERGKDGFEKHFQNSAFFIGIAVPKRANTDGIPLSEAEALARADVKRYRNYYLYRFADEKDASTTPEGASALEIMMFLVEDFDFCIQRGRLYADGKL